MDNHGSPWRISRPQTNQSYVGKFRGHEHARRPSISYQIGTNRIPMIKSIILKGQNMVLTYPRGGLWRKYWKILKKSKNWNFFFCFYGVFWYQIAWKWWIFDDFIWILMIKKSLSKNWFEWTRICRKLWRSIFCGPNDFLYS